MQVISAGRTVRYDLHGSGRRPVLLLPALGASSVMWSPQLEYFSAYTVIACETGGHYPTGGGESVRLADYAQDVCAVLDAVGLQRAHLVGLSMGGMVAQEVALAAAERVSALVLVSTTSSYPGENRELLRRRAATAEGEGMEAVVEGIVGRWFTETYRESDPDQVDAVRRDLLDADAGQYARAARAVADVNTTERLSAIDVPTLIVRGAADHSLPEDAGPTLVRSIRGARSIVMQDAAHLCNVEQAAGFNHVVREFLDRLPGSGQDENTAMLSPW
jgi:3-oxoadipate enol-lactonase